MSSLGAAHRNRLIRIGLKRRLKLSRTMINLYVREPKNVDITEEDECKFLPGRLNARPNANNKAPFILSAV